MKLSELLIAVAMAVSTTAMAATAPTPFKPGERVGFFGDSISEAGNQAFYLEYLTAIRHPGAGARFENMGKSGDTSWGGAADLSGWTCQLNGTATDKVTFKVKDGAVLAKVRRGLLLTIK